MLSNLHPKAKIQVSEHLYWGEFPFRLMFQFNSKADKWHRTKRASRSNNGREGKKVRGVFADVLANAKYRVNRLGFSVIYYLADLATAQAMVDANPEFLNLASVVMPLNDAHIEFMRAHPNIETRKDLYHGTYQFSTHFTGDYVTISALRKWCWDHAEERGPKAVKFVRKNAERIDAFFADDTELMVAKLIHGNNMGKVKQAYILNKNKNKAGIFDEPHSLSETT